jgi:hypothetical protein
MRIQVLLIVCLTQCSVVMAQNIDEPAVKKADSGICHERGSSSYKRTKHFASFNSLETCLASGGRLPANANATGASSASMEDHENLSWLSSAASKAVLIAAMLAVVAGTYWFIRGHTSRASRSARLQELERKKWEAHRLDTKE